MGSARSLLQTTLPLLLLLLLLCPGLSLCQGGASASGSSSVIGRAGSSSVIGRAGSSSVIGRAGLSVQLSCSLSPSHPPAVSSGAPYVLEWVKQGLDIPVLINYVPYPARIHPQYEGRVSLVGSTSLLLSPLKLEDQGFYECRVLSLDEAPGESQNGSWTRLTVTAPPTLVEAPPSVAEVMVGRALSLSCVANGNPAPVVTWFKDQEVLQTGALLSLPSVTAPSAGLYTCVASNSEGNTSSSTRVQVKGPPVIVAPPRNTVLNISQNALLQCRAIADPPNMTYVWFKEEENVHHIDLLKSRVKIMVDGTLLISRLLPEDSGKYTCSPSNGILAPPTASANLTVLHPAQASRLPLQLFLPTGREGVLSCSVKASPPLLRVDWSKDGETLDLELYPGWTLTSEGSVVMATVNDDVGGVYTCTPYNSYGTMGASGPITVQLQDPPWFVLVPSPRYSESVGRTLLLPCQANQEPTAKLSWSKLDVSRRVSYSVLLNGSLLLQPLTKDHQGLWECRVENRVASVSTTTQVYVLGTSPHAASSLSIAPGVREANVSWEPGFDGGSEQSFSVWVKPVSQPQDWFSVSVPLSSGSSLSIAPLSPSTLYQFSVLSQNKHGTGPFSEILTAQTKDATTLKPLPPSSLWASRDTAAGIVLRWTPPTPDLAPPLSAFVLQARCEEEEEEEWATIGEEISANVSESIVPGLTKDSVFQLRLLSRRGVLLSEPSQSISVSTVGLDMYPSTSRLLEFGPEPLLAGVLGGVAFMCLALVVLLAVACLISHKRERRLLARRRHDPPPSALKLSPSIETSGRGSPDSLLKKSLLPSADPYPSLSSGSSCSAHSARNQSRHESFSNRHSFPRSTHSFNQSTHSFPRSSFPRSTHSFPQSTNSQAIEMISRGPDGRFSSPHYDTSSIGSHKSSVSLRSDEEEPAYVLSVDLPPVRPSPYDHLYPKTIQMDKENPSYDLYSPVQPQKPSQFYEALPDFSSLCSNSSLATVPFPSPSFPVLPHIRKATASTLVLQMEHEREKGNLSRCLKLAQEREELERQLRKYTRESEGLDQGLGEGLSEGLDEGLDSVWLSRSKTLPLNASSRCSVSSVYRAGGNVARCSSVSPSCFEKERKKVSSFGAGLTLPHGSTLRHERVGGYPLYNSNPSALTRPNEPGFESTLRHERVEGYSLYNSNPAALTRPNEPGFESTLRHERVDSHPLYNSNPSALTGPIEPGFDLSHDRSSMCSLRSENRPRRSHSVTGRSHSVAGALPELPGPPSNTDVEMSVDEPELVRPKRIHSSSSQMKEQPHSIRRSKSLNSRGSGSSARSTTNSARNLETKRRSHSLDSRRRRESAFLTPDDWIHSLSQENFADMHSPRPNSLVLEEKQQQQQQQLHPRDRTRSEKNSVRKQRTRSPHDRAPEKHGSFENRGSKQQREASLNQHTPENHGSFRSHGSFENHGSKRQQEASLHQHTAENHGSFKNHGSFENRGSSRQREIDPPSSRQREPHRDASSSLPGFPHSAPASVPHLGFPLEAMRAAGRYLEEVKRPFLEEDGALGEFEEETDGYRYHVALPESGSYSSYASSGRGSLETPNCHMTNTPRESPITRLSPSHMTKESPHNMEERERESGRANHRCQRKASVDENYEWDTADVCSQLQDNDGLLPPLPLTKPALSCAPPTTHQTAHLDYAHFSPAHTEGAVLF